MSAIDELTPVPSQPEISEGNKTFSQKTYALYVWIRTKLIPAMIEMRDTIRNFVSSAYASVSSTSLTIGTGSKTLNVGVSKAYQSGNPLRIAYVTDPTKYMDGVVTAYNSSTGDLTVNVLAINGTGTFANWNIFMIPSASGLASLGANKFTGKQVLANPITITPATSLDLTVYDTNQFNLDGAPATIGSISTNLGAVIKIRVSSSAAGTIIQNITGLSVEGSSNYTCEAGDILTIIKQDTTTFVEITKQSGRPVIGTIFNASNDSTFLSSSANDAASPEWVIGRNAKTVVGISQTRQAAEATNTGATFTDGTPKYRAAGNTYTVPAGKPILIFIRAQNNGIATFYVNGSAKITSASVEYLTVSMILLPGETYSFGAAWSVWDEVR